MRRVDSKGRALVVAGVERGAFGVQREGFTLYAQRPTLDLMACAGHDGVIP